MRVKPSYKVKKRAYWSITFDQLEERKIKQFRAIEKIFLFTKDKFFSFTKSRFSVGKINRTTSGKKKICCRCNRKHVACCPKHVTQTCEKSRNWVQRLTLQGRGKPETLRETERLMTDW